MNARRLTRRQRWAALGLLALIPLTVTGLVTAVLGGAADRVDQIPALIVNNDKMVTTTNADGTTSPVLAGRLIVTQLTGADAPGFHWTLANDESAANALTSGTAYAVVTIPENFSESIASLSGATPTQANLTLTTDEAHSYLAGSLAQALGSAMTSTLGQGITEKYLAGLFGKLGSFGGSMSSAASGAQHIAAGVASLHDGLVTFSTGMSSAAAGATQAAAGAQSYVDGVSQYTQGVDGIATGLSTVARNTSDLNQLVAYCAANSVPTNLCAANGVPLTTAFAGLSTGLTNLSGAAAQLAAGSDQLRTGGTAMADGIDGLALGMHKLATGSAQSAAGAGDLANGAQGLADGLSQGAGQMSGASTNPEETAAIVAEPVTLTNTVLNPLASVRDLIALLILPAALWLGALAITVARRPFVDTDLQSTRGSLRIVVSSLARSLGFGAIQVLFALGAAALVGVPAKAIALGGMLALVASAAFIAVHLLLKLVWPRAANLVSMVLLIAQIVVLPGVLPSQMLPNWIQPVASAFPMTWAMNGMQAIVAGTGYSAAVSAAVGLLLLAAVAAGVSTLLLSRRRLRAGLGFVVARAA